MTDFFIIADAKLRFFDKSGNLDRQKSQYLLNAFTKNDVILISTFFLRTIIRVFLAQRFQLIINLSSI